MKHLLSFLLWCTVFGISHVSAAYVEGRMRVTFRDAARGKDIPVTIVYPAEMPGGLNAPLVGTSNGTTPDFGVVVIAHGFQLPVSAYTSLASSVAQSPMHFISVLPETASELFPDHAEFGKDIVACVASMQAEAKRQGSFWYGHVRNENVLIGHSMGGGASFLAAKTLCEQKVLNLAALIGLAPAETNPSSTAAAASVTCPALILAGGADCITPLSAIQPMYNALASSCKTLGVIPGGSHCQFADENTLCQFGEFTCPPTISRAAQTVITFTYIQRMLERSNRVTEVVGTTQIQTTMAYLQSSDIKLSKKIGCLGDTIIVEYTGPVKNILWLPDSVRTPVYRYVIRARENVISVVNTTCFGTDAVDTMVVWARPPELTLVGSSELCPGDSVVLRAAANIDATVDWSTGATTREIVVRTPGTYIARATSIYGCGEELDTIVVRQVVLPRLNVRIEGDTVLCNGAGGMQFELQAEGTEYQRVVWSTGDTSATIRFTEPGEYELSATLYPKRDSGCVIRFGPTRFNVRNYEPPTTTIELRNDTLWASPSADQFQWYYRDIGIAGWSKRWYVPSIAGPYRVIARSRTFGNCPSESAPYIYEPTSVPTDTEVQFRVTWDHGSLCVQQVRVGETLRMYSYEGREVHRWTSSDEESCTYVGDLAPAVYVIVREDGTVQTVVVQ